MPTTTENLTGTAAIRPFTVPVTSDEELEALRGRVASTRWPGRELVTDHFSTELRAAFRSLR